MAKKIENKLVASHFRLKSATDNYLLFVIKATGDRVVQSYCSSCPLEPVCYGEKGSYEGSVRINLNSPIAQNLSSADAQNVPCGAGIEVIQRRKLRK